MSAPTFYQRVSAVLSQHLKRGDRVAVGLSGGVDSVVLLDVLRRFRKQKSGAQKIELRAVHINHQLSPNAGIWARFCRALCREWDIPLQVVKVEVARGNSVEAAARAERYKVFFKRRVDVIVLAHHLDDQGETLLLQLLRGAGIHGLSAMPVLKAGISENKKPALLRPLLDISRAEILEYARSRKLRWVEDESNEDTHYDRNFLRHEVLPVIAQRYPGYRATLARASRHLAEASQLLDALAAQDLPADALTNINAGIALETLQVLGAVRAKNLLRFYFRNAGIDAPNAAQLDECVRQALRARADSEMRMALSGHAGDYELRCFARRLYLVKKMPALPTDYVRAWRGEETWTLPELGGQFEFRYGKGVGISLAKLEGKIVTVRLRLGGERFQSDSQRPRRSLKHILQEMRIPPWQRERLPLLYCKEHLIYVPGIGVDSAFQATVHEESIAPQWNLHTGSMQDMPRYGATGATERRVGAI